MNKYGDNHDKLNEPRNRGDVLSQALKQIQKKTVEETAYVDFFNGICKMWGWGVLIQFIFLKWLVITRQDNDKQKYMHRSSA